MMLGVCSVEEPCPPGNVLGTISATLDHGYGRGVIFFAGLLQWLGATRASDPPPIPEQSLAAVLVFVRRMKLPPLSG